MYIVLSIFGMVVLYLLAIMPKMLNRPDMSPFQEYFAHRGLHQEGDSTPENSLAAFTGAVNNHYGIELDVQLSKDRVPVVFHDYSLGRMCGIDRRVADLTYGELRKCSLHSSDEKIPHLQEVLDLVQGRVPLIIELKMETADISLCNVIAPILDKYTGVYGIESFNPLGLLWFKRNRPKIIRGQLSTDFIRAGETGDRKLYFILKNLLLNFVTKPNFIAYHYKYSKALSFNLCNKIYRPTTIAWTIDSKEALEECKKNFDIFIFEGFVPTKDK